MNIKWDDWLSWHCVCLLHAPFQRHIDTRNTLQTIQCLMNWCKLPLYSLRLALCDPIEVVWCRDKVDYPSTGPSAGVQHCPKGFLARMCSSVQLKRPISVFRIRRHAQKGSVYQKNTRLFLLCVQIADYHTSNITTLTMWRWLYFHWNELINVNNLLFGCQTTNKYISSFFFSFLFRNYITSQLCMSAVFGQCV